MWWRKAAALPVVIGMIGAFCIMVAVSQIKWHAGIGRDGKPLMASIAWPWFTLIGTVAALSIAWLTRAVVARERLARVAVE